MKYMGRRWLLLTLVAFIMLGSFTAAIPAQEENSPESADQIDRTISKSGADWRNGPPLILTHRPIIDRSSTLTDWRKNELIWVDNYQDETGYTVEKKESNGQFAVLASLPPDSTSLEITAPYGESTVFRLKAFRGAELIGMSNRATIRPWGGKLNMNNGYKDMTVPASPSGLTAEVYRTGEVCLKWHDNADNETGFIIERSYQDTFINVIEAGDDRETAIDPSATTGTYLYRVLAYNGDIESTPSNQVTVVVPPLTEEKTAISIPETAGTAPLTRPISIELQIGSNHCCCNGEDISMDTAPVIIEGRVMLPLRSVIEALGGTIEWDESTQQSTIRLHGHTLQIWIGKHIALLDGQPIEIDPDNSQVMPCIVPPGRCILPLRFVAESLGCAVQWQGSTQKIIINYLEE